MGRRRGEALDDAILDAVWDQFLEAGYGSLTYKAVAQRARTGRAVVQRRWDSRLDMLRAAVRRQGEMNPLPVPDTGSLRTDVLALLEATNELRAGFIGLLSANANEAYNHAAATPADLLHELIGGRGSTMRKLLEQADQRGEVDLAALPDRVIDLPMALLRHDILLTLRPAPPHVLRSIVDDVFLPLVHTTHA